MPWYAAHAIMYVRFKDGQQDHYPVWENVLLVKAEDGDAARRKAVAWAKQGEGDSENSFRWDGRPATWVFAGLRKVISVSHSGLNDVPGDGDEITYSEFDLADEQSLKALVGGDETTVKYVD